MHTPSHDPLSPVEAEAGGQGNGREKARDSLFLTAGFRLIGEAGAGDDGEWRQVRVRNLSAGGLMAEVADPLDIGTSVEIDLRGVGLVPGRVAWSTAGRIGVAFDRQIEPMAARKPVGGVARRPRIKAPPR